MSDNEPDGCSLALAVLAMMAGLALSACLLGGAAADAEAKQGQSWSQPAR